MPLFYQHNINGSTKLGIWRIAEEEDYFKVPLQRSITHPHKRLQHLAGRWLLKQLFPDFPYELIQIADTRKPFLANEAYHFSISHCGDFAAAIVSSESRVGIDIEIPTEKIERISTKFLNEEELGWVEKLSSADRQNFLTLLWSAKESVFKWYGDGEVDFRQHILLQQFQWEEIGLLDARFMKDGPRLLPINYSFFPSLCLAWVVT